ncbi:2-octaprenyl-6-methoxyphenyl hydroxylase [Ferrimonas senticii]|uniref:2-octaprenyl-6-methoxyphenyl hydroxylase n=1 Tax=Ferrimonas senticii TaxID=394566 RepID=UPI00042672F0|nr:2-octaprenyl-6-methoxyphenyl hydroxylase [Ferrimonas senticii]
MAKSPKFDVVIVGGAMAGATLALALSRLTGNDGQPLAVALVEANPSAAAASPQASGFDARSIALANGSVQILQQLGLWSLLGHHGAAIERIEVSDRGHFAGLAMTAAEYQQPFLGQVVELERLGPALWQQLEHSSVQLFCPNKVTSIGQFDDHIDAELDDGQRLSSRLLVGADGTQSPVRQLLGLNLDSHCYGQSAIIANLRFSDSQAHSTAFERFTSEGPLALLPMTEQRYSLVWVQTPEQAARRLQLDDAGFAMELQRAFGMRLGTIEQVGERSSYPLSLSRAGRLFHHRAVLIGNAAQTVHPIAGQGFNLGLRDVAALLASIQQGLANDVDIGSFAQLRAYADSRQTDRAEVLSLTDGLVQLFSNSVPLIALGRNVGLLSMALLPQWKQKLAAQAMGWKR